MYLTNKTYFQVIKLTVRCFHNHHQILRTQRTNHIPNQKHKTHFYNLISKKMNALNTSKILTLVKKLMMGIISWFLIKFNW